MADVRPHRGRFAPSPTGRLHLGNARSALLGWLWARSEGGEFLLRIEDLDAARCRPEHLETLRADLAYLGLTFDGTPVFQSQRAPAYDEALARLTAQGRVYPCFCTRAEIARAATAPHGASDDGPRYPGTCLGLGAELAGSRAAKRPPALRFRPSPGIWTFQDAIAGAQSQDVEATVGDFVVRRNDGVASYQLAVVVDDLASGVTHVLRGDDLLGSTPRQLQLYAALGASPPAFAHVGLLVGTNGQRMAKREGALAVAELRTLGVPPEAVLGMLAAWSGLSDGRPASAASLVPDFALSRLRRGPVVVEEEDVKRTLRL